MKVLLLQDVENLGWLGDVIDVSTGYARNYLLPAALAVVPNEANIKAIAQTKARHAEKRINQRQKLEQAAAEVDQAEAVIAVKTNEKGHLFGSVMAADIAANLREQGFSVADRIVQLPEHIKEVGTYPVTLNFAGDLKVTISLVVVAK